MPLGYGGTWSLSRDGLLGASVSGVGLLRYAGLAWDRLTAPSTLGGARGRRSWPSDSSRRVAAGARRAERRPRPPTRRSSVTFDAPSAAAPWVSRSSSRRASSGRAAAARRARARRARRRLPGRGLAAVEPTGPDGGGPASSRRGHVIPNTPYRYRFRAVTEDGEAPRPRGRASRRRRARRVAFDQRRRRPPLVVRGRRRVRRAGPRDRRGGARVGLGPARRRAWRPGRRLRLRRRRGRSAARWVPARARTSAARRTPPSARCSGSSSPARSDRTGSTSSSATSSSTSSSTTPRAAPSRYPPRWLNEGVAVYLSRGLDAGDRAQVAGRGRAPATIIPLEGLAGQFPTRPGRFGLAYAESASAVDVPRRDVTASGARRDRRWLRRRPDGDSSTRPSAGRSASTCDASRPSWLERASALSPIEPTGPRPAPPGPVPDAWRSDPVPLIR